MAGTEVRKKVSELLVKDLRAELEKRGLEQKGIKAVLLERLQGALRENGEDPDTILIEQSLSPRISKTSATEQGEMEASSGDNSGEVTIEEEEDEDVVMELIEDSDDDNLEEEDIYGDLEVMGGSQEEQGMEEGQEDIEDMNVSLDTAQFPAQEREEEDQEGDVEDEVSCALDSKERTGSQTGGLSKSSILGAEQVTEAGEEEDSSLVADASDPTSDTKETDESMVEPVEETEDSESEEPTTGEPTKAQPEKAQSALREEGSKVTKTVSGNPGNIVAQTKTDADGGKSGSGKTPANKDLASEKKATPATGTVAQPSKSQSSTGKDPPKGTESKDAKSSTSNCNIWVSGLSKETRAADLKTIFSKYGKVIGAKIIWNAKLPGHHCYGFLSMSSQAEASKAIDQLHRTKLHGHTIDVTWARNQTAGSVAQKSPTSTSSTPTAKKDDKEKSDVKQPAAKPVSMETKDEKKEKAPSVPEKKEDKGLTAKKEGSVGKEVDKKNEKPTTEAKTNVEDKNDKTPSRGSDTKRSEPSSAGKDSSRRSSSASDKDKKVFSLDEAKEKQRKEYQRRKEREREREEREAERRRDKEREERIRREREDVQRRYREELRKLRKEKEQLEIEQGKMAKERAERQRIEKDRLKMVQEREKFQRELQEFRKMENQLKIDQERLATLKRTLETQTLATQHAVAQQVAAQQAAAQQVAAQQAQQAAAQQAQQAAAQQAQQAAAQQAQQAQESYTTDRKRRAMMQEGMMENFNNTTPSDTRLVVAVGERHVEKYDQRQNQGGASAQHNLNQGQFSSQQQSGFSGSGGSSGIRDSSSASHYREDSNQRRDDRSRSDVERRYESGRRSDDRRDGSRQRSIIRDGDQSRNDSSRKRGDSYRRDEGYKRIEEPIRRLDSRKDSRDHHDRDERRAVLANQQGNRYQGSGTSRGGDSSYSIRDSQRDTRDFRDDRDKARDSSSARMPSHGGGSGESRDGWKGSRDGSSMGSGSNWKSNMGGENQSLGRPTVSGGFGNFQQQQKQDFPMQSSAGQGRMTGSTSLLGRGDLMMNQQEPLQQQQQQQQNRGSILGEPPSQESASWPPSGLDTSINRGGGSGSLSMQNTSRMANIMNQNQPMGAMMSNQNTMGSQFMGGGSGGVGGTGVGLMGNMGGGGIMGNIGGSLGGNMGMMSQGSMGSSGFIGGNQMPMGSPSVSMSMDQMQQMQPDNRFSIRRY